ncbi:hypothetical protein SLS58_010337 [Diplodia intermedia]|uniref:AA1-like domain-containing protein n=1 Tax=Diplodia intermedia TaxID=856260 RepID=A0ABR3T7B0_9PEZI
MRLSTAIALLCAAAASAATIKPTHRVSVPGWWLWTKSDQTTVVRFTIENDDPKKPKYNCEGEEADLKNNGLVQCFRDENTESSIPITTYWFGLSHETLLSNQDYNLTLYQAIGRKPTYRTFDSVSGIGPLTCYSSARAPGQGCHYAQKITMFL